MGPSNNRIDHQTRIKHACAKFFYFLGAARPSSAGSSFPLRERPLPKADRLTAAVLRLHTFDLERRRPDPVALTRPRGSGPTSAALGMARHNASQGRHESAGPWGRRCNQPLHSPFQSDNSPINRAMSALCQKQTFMALDHVLTHGLEISGQFRQIRCLES